MPVQLLPRLSFVVLLLLITVTAGKTPRLLHTLVPSTGAASSAGGCLDVNAKDYSIHSLGIIGSPNYYNKGDNFGERVALEGNVLAVSTCNAVSVFEKDDDDPRAAWNFTTTLTSESYFNNRMEWEYYPFSVVVSGGQIFVGHAMAYGSESGSGAVNVYEKVDGTWTRVQRLTPPPGPYSLIYAGFGASLKVKNGIMVVGAPGPSPANDNGYWADSQLVAILEQNSTTRLWDHAIDNAEADIYPPHRFANQGRGLWTNGKDEALFTTWRWSSNSNNDIGLTRFSRRTDGSGWDKSTNDTLGIDVSSYPASRLAGSIMFSTPDNRYLFFGHNTDLVNPHYAVFFFNTHTVDLYEDLDGDGTYALATAGFITANPGNSETEFGAHESYAATNTTLMVQEAFGFAGATVIFERDLTGAGAWNESFRIEHAGKRMQGFAIDGTIGVLGDASAQEIYIYDIACGNGVVNTELGETCDDGNNVNGDGCYDDCIAEGCGNGRVEAGEQCDDGNLFSNDGCDSSCVSEFCGDGVIWEGQEECDDNNTVSGDGCDAACLVEFCGDGIINNAESCDDGLNGIEGDGCTSECEGKTVCIVEECPYPARQQCTAFEGGECECLPGFSGDTCSSHTAQAASAAGAGGTLLLSLAGLVAIPLVRPTVPGAAIARSDKEDKKSKTQNDTSADGQDEVKPLAPSPPATPPTSSPTLERAHHVQRSRGAKPSAAALASIESLKARIASRDDPNQSNGELKQVAKASRSPENIASRAVTTVAVVQLCAFGLDPTLFPWREFGVPFLGSILGLTHLSGVSLRTTVPICAGLAVLTAVVALVARFGSTKGVVGKYGGILLAVLVGMGFVPITRTLGSVLVCTAPTSPSESPIVVSDTSIACYTSEYWSFAALAWVGLLAFFPVALHSAMVSEDRSNDVEIRWTRGARVRMILAQTVLVLTAVVGVGLLGRALSAFIMIAALACVLIPLYDRIFGLSCSLLNIQFLTGVGVALATGCAVGAWAVSWAENNGLETVGGFATALFLLGSTGFSVLAALYYASVISPSVTVPSEKLLAAHPSPWRAWVAAELAEAKADLDTARKEQRYKDAQKLLNKRSSLEAALKAIREIEQQKVVSQAELETALVNLAPQAELEAILEKIVEFDRQLDEQLANRLGESHGEQQA